MPKAIVTSIGEPTTDLCVWSLERQGFEVILKRNPNTSLWQKLKEIYDEAETDFIRVDADVIVNRNVKRLIELQEAWWYQVWTFDWHAQNITHGGVQFIRRPALNAIRLHINEAKDLERPESYLYRLAEFHNPRRCITWPEVCGLHGYKQKDWERIIATKARRNQLDNYDFELSYNIEAL